MNNSYYQPMECPVCGKFFFAELQEGEDIHDLQCTKCGWRYDYEQALDHDLKDGNNALSVNEFIEWYHGKVSENPHYDYSDEHCPPNAPHPCPVCGEHIFKDRDCFDICPICGWTDDGLMEDEPNRWEGNSNDLCLNDFRERYLKNNHS